jgi:hypothetical protein
MAVHPTLEYHEIARISPHNYRAGTSYEKREERVQLAFKLAREMDLVKAFRAATFFRIVLATLACLNSTHAWQRSTINRVDLNKAALQAPQALTAVTNRRQAISGYMALWPLLGAAGCVRAASPLDPTMIDAKVSS